MATCVQFYRFVPAQKIKARFSDNHFRTNFVACATPRCSEEQLQIRRAAQLSSHGAKRQALPKQAHATKSRCCITDLAPYPHLSHNATATFLFFQQPCPPLLPSNMAPLFLYFQQPCPPLLLPSNMAHHAVGMPGHSQIGNTYNEFVQQMLDASQATGFSQVFIGEVSDVMRNHASMQAGGKFHINFMVPSSTINQEKLVGLLNLLAMETNREMVSSFVPQAQLPHNQIRLVILHVPTDRAIGSVLFDRTFTVNNPVGGRSLGSMVKLIRIGIVTAGSNVVRADTKSLCAVIGMIALLIAAFFPVTRSAMAGVGVITTTTAISASPTALDAVLNPFNGGVNIGTAIPSGQQLTELWGVGTQNFTFAVVSSWQGLALLLACMLTSMDQESLNSQTFTAN